MNKREVQQHQRDALFNAIDAFGGQLNKLGLTMSYDTPKMEVARVALKSAWLELNQELNKSQGDK
jgi:hypothetical protein